MLKLFAGAMLELCWEFAGSCRDYAGTMLGLMLGLCWDYSGTMLGDYAEAMQGD